MGTSYGRKVGDTTSDLVQVSADGKPFWKAGGITIDWTTITAVSGADVTLLGGRIVKIGDKYIRFGTVLSKITASGKYGPVDTTAADGRETVTDAKRGAAFILNKSVVESDLGSDHAAVFDGGLVFQDRILVTGTGAPTIANVRTMFPSITFQVE